MATVGMQMQQRHVGKKAMFFSLAKLQAQLSDFGAVLQRRQGSRFSCFQRSLCALQDLELLLKGLHTQSALRHPREKVQAPCRPAPSWLSRLAALSTSRHWLERVSLPIAPWSHHEVHGLRLSTALTNQLDSPHTKFRGGLLFLPR